MGIEPTHQLVTGALVLKTRGATRTPTAPRGGKVNRLTPGTSSRLGDNPERLLSGANSGVPTAEGEVVGHAARLLPGRREEGHVAERVDADAGRVDAQGRRHRGKAPGNQAA